MTHCQDICGQMLVRGGGLPKTKCYTVFSRSLKMSMDIDAPVALSSRNLIPHESATYIPISFWYECMLTLLVYYAVIVEHR